MLPIYTPENPFLSECPTLIIAEIQIGEDTKRTSQLSTSPADLPHALAATLFSSDSISEHELGVLESAVAALQKDEHWLRDDATGAPLDCHFSFKDGEVTVTVRCFALPQIALST